MENIVKRFGGTLAVNHVDLAVGAGRVTALLGENGAGKSTLIKVLAGVYPRDAGRILFEGRPLEAVGKLSRDGDTPVTFIHQDLGLVEWMTVAENMAFTMGFPKTLGIIRWKRMNLAAGRALAEVGLDIDPEARVFELSRTEKSLLAIARAVSVRTRILVLDEPTASLPAADVQRLFRVIAGLKAGGVGMIYVTHRLDEVMEIADDVVVMRDGRKVADAERTRYRVRDLVNLIVGDGCGNPEASFSRPEGGEAILAAEGLRIGDIGPVDFTLRRGEVLALAGLRGAGQEETGRALFGRKRIDGGGLKLRGGDYRPRTPAEAIQAGVGMLPGERAGESLAMTLTVRENLFLNPAAQGTSPYRFYPPGREARRGEALVRDFDIRPPLVEIDIAALSGGNQQKVTMARWLNVPGRVLVLEDPTAGVDVGARTDIYRILGEALKRGLGVVLVSSDFEEVAKICSRALVFNRGRVAIELRGTAISFANLVEYSSSDRAIPDRGSADDLPRQG
jgi:ribose transport system ATP-binding protein